MSTSESTLRKRSLSRFHFHPATRAIGSSAHSDEARYLARLSVPELVLFKTMFQEFPREMRDQQKLDAAREWISTGGGDRDVRSEAAGFAAVPELVGSRGRA